MKINEAHHIGILVEDQEKAIQFYAKVLGARIEETPETPGFPVKVVFLRLPGTPRLELIQSLGAGGRVARFLAEKGYGLYHLAFHVENLDEAIAEARAAGAELMDKVPMETGWGERAVYLKPQSLGGVIVELVGK